MKMDFFLRGFLLLMTVLASADEFSNLFNNEQDDTARILRGYIARNKAKKASTLPPVFSKVMTGEADKEEKKYECEDKLPEDCPHWKELGICKEDEDVLKHWCKKSCNFCESKPVPAPTPCQVSEHGCCWDGVSVAEGPNQEGCPECLNDKYSILCRRFSDYCLLSGKNREWVRQQCPATCIKLWKRYAEKTYPLEELKENLVYNAWQVCYSGRKSPKRSDLGTLLDGLSKMK